MKEKTALKYYEELKNEKGALIGQNKSGKSTLGIEKPMELDNTDTVTMQREKGKGREDEGRRRKCSSGGFWE